MERKKINSKRKRENNEPVKKGRTGRPQEDLQQTSDYGVSGKKGRQQQGNHGSRQGDGGNRGVRGNSGLG